MSKTDNNDDEIDDNDEDDEDEDDPNHSIDTDVDDSWLRVVIGCVMLPTACKSVKMEILGEEGLTWKRDVAFDYFQLAPVRFAPRSLQQITAKVCAAALKDDVSTAATSNNNNQKGEKEQQVVRLERSLSLPKKLAALVQAEAEQLKRMKGEGMKPGEMRKSVWKITERRSPAMMHPLERMERQMSWPSCVVA